MSVYARQATTGQVSDDATFRTWGKFFADSLQAGGWTKVTDAGQIDWATITRPAGTGAAGYEVRQSTDGAGATIYMKIEYGAGGNTSTTNPMLWLTLGTGQNGSGTLTGTVSTRKEWGYYQDTGPHSFHISVTTSRFSFVIVENTQNGAYGCSIAVQRTCDASGADDATGFLYVICTTISGNSVPSYLSGFVDFTNGQAGEETAPTWMWTQNIPRQTLDKPLFFPVFVRGSSTHVMVRDMVISVTNSAPGRSVSTLTHFGSARKYVTGVSGTGTGMFGYTPPVSMAFLARCE